MHEIRQATVDRVPAICAMLTRAFADDPMVVWPVGNVDDLGSVQHRLFELVDVPFTELGLVWEIGDAFAAAAWIPPDSIAAYVGIDVATRPIVRRLTADAGRRWEAMWDWIEERIPSEPLWLLDHVGVDPTHQGKGLGGTLIEHGLELARKDGVGAFLETAVPANVAYYERFGFTVVEEGDAPLGGPHIWFMRL